MEDETGLLPIKENDMKYYVYVSTPIALGFALLLGYCLIRHVSREETTLEPVV